MKSEHMETLNRPVGDVLGPEMLLEINRPVKMLITTFIPFAVISG